VVGAVTAEPAKPLEVSDQTLHRWRNHYGGVMAAEAKQQKDVEKEHMQLRRIVASQALDLDAMRGVAPGNFWARHADALQSKCSRVVLGCLQACVPGCWAGPLVSALPAGGSQSGCQAEGVAARVLCEASALG
jgi:putative transposase